MRTVRVLPFKNPYTQHTSNKASGQKGSHSHNCFENPYIIKKLVELMVGWRFMICRCSKQITNWVLVPTHRANQHAANSIDNIMQLALIPPYLVYDYFKSDVDAGIIYECLCLLFLWSKTDLRGSYSSSFFSLVAAIAAAPFPKRTSWHSWSMLS